MRKHKALLLLAFLIAACSPAVPYATPNEEVLADCFLTFTVNTWVDTNSNTEYDSSETPLQNVEVRLEGPFAQMFSPNPCMSESEGICTFSTWSPEECLAGDYSIHVTAPKGYTAAPADTIPFSIDASTFAYTAEFGFLSSE